MKGKNKTKERLISELEKAQERLYAIFESVSDGVAVTNLELRIIDINEAGLRIFGYNHKREVIGLSGLELISPKDHAKAMADMRSTLEKGHSSTLEYTFLDKREREFLAEYSVIVMKDESGSPAGFVATMKDVTERKRAEEALRKEKEFSYSLIAAMQDGFSVLDSNGVHIDVNHALCEMTGFSREELIGVGTPHPYWAPEAYEEINRAFQKTLQGEFAGSDLTFMRKNGERFLVIVSPSWIKDEQGNVVSYFATVKDVTERKQVEETLKYERDKAQNYLNIAGVLIVAIDPLGKVTLINRKGCQILGYSVDYV